MISVEFSDQDKEKVRRLLNKITSVEARDNAVAQSVQDVGTFINRILETNVSGIILKKRTGNLSRTLGVRPVARVDGMWQSVVGSGAMVESPTMSEGGNTESVGKDVRMIYADILEDGGVIAMKDKWMTIPLPESPVLTGAGVQRYTAQQLRENPSLGGFDRTRVIFPIIYGINKSSKGQAKMTPLWVLKDHVTIPPFKYMQTTVDDGASEVGGVMVNRIEKELQKQ